MLQTVTVPADREPRICRAYRRGYSVPQIARHLGVWDDAIYNVLRRHRVPLRRRGTPRKTPSPKPTVPHS